MHCDIQQSAFATIEYVLMNLLSYIVTYESYAADFLFTAS